MAAEDQSDRMSSDMKVQMKQRYVIECFHSEKIVPTDICLHLLSISGDQTVDVSTARQWVMVFSSGNSRPFSLVQVFTSMACRLFFVASENT